MDGNLESIIDKKIDKIINNNNIYHVARVSKVNDFIVEVIGLESCFYFEKILVGSKDNIGYVDKIEENKVVIAMVKITEKIKVGDNVNTTGEVLMSSYSHSALGRIIDPFGVDKMSGRLFNDSVPLKIETQKFPLMVRTSVNRPLETGIAAIDLMYPIGKGQRQLIIGDKKTGKTQICLDTIANQKDKNVICIYVAIGKTKSEVKRIYTKLAEKGACDYTFIIAAFNDDPAPLIKLTPYMSVSLAEVYMKKGYDVLICIDDLKKHADACREIALISQKNSGRESYPADIFYCHSRLLEKGGQYLNGASITILPIVETKGGDITDYISTNIISITDGQIVLSDKLFAKGQKPAINFGLSVSRLGGAVQDESIRETGSVLRRELLSYLETADVYQLVNLDTMSAELREKTLRGKKLLELLKQPKYNPFSTEELKEKFSFLFEEKEENIETKEIEENKENQQTKENEEKKEE